MVFLFVSCGPFCFYLDFSLLSKKKTNKKKDTAKTKAKMQEIKKRTKNQLAQLCSQIVFMIFWGGLKNADFAENTIKIVVPAYLLKGKRVPK